MANGGKKRGMMMREKADHDALSQYTPFLSWRSVEDIAADAEARRKKDGVETVSRPSQLFVAGIPSLGTTALVGLLLTSKDTIGITAYAWASEVDKMFSRHGFYEKYVSKPTVICNATGKPPTRKVMVQKAVRTTGGRIVNINKPQMVCEPVVLALDGTVLQQGDGYLSTKPTEGRIPETTWPNRWVDPTVSSLIPFDNIPQMVTQFVTRLISRMKLNPVAMTEERKKTRILKLISFALFNVDKVVDAFTKRGMTSKIIAMVRSPCTASNDTSMSTPTMYSAYYKFLIEFMLPKLGRDVFVLRYEDLCINPERVVAQLKLFHPSLQTIDLTKTGMTPSGNYTGVIERLIPITQYCNRARRKWAKGIDDVMVSSYTPDALDHLRLMNILPESY